jgi:transposase
MLSTAQINELHRLYWSERWPIRKIERHLRISWRTIRKYLDAPAQRPSKRPRTSKLDPFKSTIAEWLEKDATVTGTVIEQRLRPLGYIGGPTILRDYLQTVRPQSKPARAFIRMEPGPGERFEVDWAHFGSLDYSGDKRKLYAFALVEAHSRMLDLEFTHSQSFETFVRCHLHAFAALAGVAREIAYDFVPGNIIRLLWRVALCGGDWRDPRRSGRVAWMTEHNSYSESSHLIRSGSFRHPPVGRYSAERSTGGRHAATAACLVRNVISA